ncbi:host attachment protein [Pseudogemmobacter sp. W21_MBD1_M6]|uniref:host attachment protein n=1 Tax=Pseudogemmobacter sp. W21_MBD1_M6 TaxID=3240271 RepID=UPI003F9C0D51
MKNEKLWVLVLNSTRARILRNLGRDGSTTEAELVLRSENRHLKDIMSDKPGRSFASVGDRRSAMAYGSDPVFEDERAFAKEVLSVLETHRRAGDFDQLAVFSEPEMLGILRKEYPNLLKEKILGEYRKNLLHESEQDLPRIVAKDLFQRNA